MIPAHRNFAQSQSGSLRQIEQFDVESETFDARGLENRSARIEPERLESALRVPKRQPGCEPHDEIKNAAALFAPPRLVIAD